MTKAKYIMKLLNVTKPLFKYYNPMNTKELESYMPISYVYIIFHLIKENRISLHLKVYSSKNK